MGAERAARRATGRAAKPLVERHARLDIRRIGRAAPVRAGVPLRVAPERGGRDGAPAAVTLLVGEAGLALRYATAAGTVRQAVGLARTACHFGGERAWFVCPGGGGRPCGRRAATLYYDATGRRFACRACLGLAYRSQREAGVARARRWHARAAGRLGAAPELGGGRPRRPRGMHRSTYARRLAEYRAAREAHLCARMAAAYARFLALPGVAPGAQAAGVVRALAGAWRAARGAARERGRPRATSPG